MSDYPRGYKPGQIYGDPTAYDPVEPEYPRGYKPGQIYGDTTAYDTPASPASVGPAPTTTRTNANKIQQSGRNFSGNLTLGDATDYLRRSTNGYVQGFGKDWNSQTLPATGEYDESSTTGIGPVADGARYSGMLGVTGVGPVIDGDAYANLVENPELAGKSADAPQTLSEALADKSSLKFDSSKYKASEGFEAPVGTISNEERARRGAFLDAPGVLEGMKAVKAMNNTMSLGGRDYAVGENGLTEISGQNQRDILSGKAKAQDFLKSKVDSLKDDGNITPSAEQNPDVLDESDDMDMIDPNSRNVPGRMFGPGGGF